ncbi:hypothetical protein [Gimesia sp.]|uniref:hypothetical protein n=1 Tax=Gimesia sp. TaxID=2024833 RepID=UPI0025C13A0B|nr:hypothetical protein [Gimesia sp.]
MYQVQHADRKTKNADPILVIADNEKDIRTEMEWIETVTRLCLQQIGRMPEGNGIRRRAV